MNNTEITILCVGIALLLYFSLCNIVVNLIFIRPKRRTLKNLVDDEVVSKKVPADLFDIPFTQWIAENEKGECFSARYYDFNSDKYAILLHGHNAYSLGAVRFLASFRRLGYSVVLPDLSRSGISDGKTVTFGIKESEIVLMWIKKIKELNKNAFIGIMGISMGGATSVISTAKSKDIKFMVSYCPYASVYSIVDGFKKRYAPLRLFVPGIKLMFYANGLNFKKNSPLNSAKDITCPALLIHSKGDKLINYTNSERIFSALTSAPIKEIKLFEGAGHGHCPTLYTQEFEQTVERFVKKAEDYHANTDIQNET